MKLREYEWKFILNIVWVGYSLLKQDEKPPLSLVFPQSYTASQFLVRDVGGTMKILA